jgi:hypothetical protein
MLMWCVCVCVCVCVCIEEEVKSRSKTEFTFDRRERPTELWVNSVCVLQDSRETRTFVAAVVFLKKQRERP